MAWFGAPKRAKVRPYVNFDALAICDCCGMAYAHSDLAWQYEYQGFGLVNLNLLHCPECLDVPNIQAAAIIIPPDPRPVLDPRPPTYYRNSYDTRVTQEDATRVDQSGDTRVTAEFIPLEGYDPNSEQPMDTEADDLMTTETGNAMITE